MGQQRPAKAKPFRSVTVEVLFFIFGEEGYEDALQKKRGRERDRYAATKSKTARDEKARKDLLGEVAAKHAAELAEVKGAHATELDLVKAHYEQRLVDLLEQKKAEFWAEKRLSLNSAKSRSELVKTTLPLLRAELADTAEKLAAAELGKQKAEKAALVAQRRAEQLQNAAANEHRQEVSQKDLEEARREANRLRQEHGSWEVWYSCLQEHAGEDYSFWRKLWKYGRPKAAASRDSWLEQ